MISVDRRTGAQGPPRTWGNTGTAAIEEAWHCLDNGRCRRRYPDGAAGNPIKGEGEPFRSLCAQVKLSDLVVVITALSRFFLYIYTGGEASSWTGVSGLQNVGSIPTYRLPLLFFKTSANDFWVVYNITIQEARKHGT